LIRRLPPHHGIDPPDPLPLPQNESWFADDLKRVFQQYRRSLTAYTISPRRQFLPQNGLSPFMENDHAIRTNLPAPTFSLLE
jgi:hypothetical protein